MHIYPIHDLIVVLSGGVCGSAVTLAIEDVYRVLHTGEKDQGR
jgi:hypothetical protein